MYLHYAILYHVFFSYHIPLCNHFVSPPAKPLPIRDLRRLRLPRAALAGDDEALVLAVPHQRPVGRVRDGIGVRRQGADVLPAIPLALLQAIEPLHVLVGVHR